MTTTGTCPVCLGSCRKAVPEETRKYLKYNGRWGHWGIAGYEPGGEPPFADGCGYEGGTLPCTNCGGATMSCRGTGQVRLRPDGTPCLHKYTGQTVGNCYHRYTCTECGDVYHIDSGD